MDYWVSETDNGQSHAINKGWKIATGDIYAWLNSDDLLVPGTLFNVARIWIKNQNIGFIHGKADVINKSGVTKNKTYGAHFDLVESLLSSKNTVAQCTTFISKSALDIVGFLDTNFHLSMDWDLWLRISSLFDSIFIPEILSKFRVWDLSKTSTAWKKAEEEHVRIVKKFFCQKNIPIECMKLRRRAISSAYAREAVIAYRSKESSRFRKAMLHALIYDPTLRISEGRRLLPIFLLGRNIYSASKNLISRI